MTLTHDPDGKTFLTEVCWHYFVHQMTQAEVAAALGVTRLRVNQAIQQARRLDMVKIQVESPHLPRFALQEELKAKFALADALVVPANLEKYDFHTPVGVALAGYLIENISAKGWRRIGVSWGITMQSAIRNMPKQSLTDCEVISMIGGTSKGDTFNSFGVASGLAERLGTSYSLLASPVFLSDEQALGVMIQQETIRTHYKSFETLDVALMTASNVSAHSYLVQAGLPKDISESELLAAGAVGDVVGRFLNAEGGIASHEINARTMGIDLDLLQKVPDRVLAAAGHHKVEIIRAALAGGLVNRLVTDDVTATLLLKAGP